MEKYFEKLSRYLSLAIGGSEEEFERINYMLKIYFYNIIKLTALMGTFLLSGYFIEGTIGTVIVLISKPFYGGYHEDSNLKCFIASLCLVSAAIYLGKANELDTYSLIIMNAASFYAIYHQVPLFDKTDDFVPSEMVIRKYRKRALMMTLAIMSSFIVFCHNRQYVTIGTWTVLLQSLTLFIKKKRF